MQQVEDLDIEAIVAGPETQTRAATDMATVEAYAATMKEGSLLPPPVVFTEPGRGEDATIWLADGFHRLAAAKSLGMKTIACVVYIGGMRDALKWSLKSNEDHGLPLTIADRRRKLAVLINDLEWKNKSIRDMAAMLSMSPTTVARLLKEIDGDRLSETVVDKRGGTHQRKKPPTKPAARKKAKPEPEQEPIIDETTVERQPAPEPEELLDELGKPVPPELLGVFGMSLGFKQVAKDLELSMDDIRALANGIAGHYLKMHVAGIERELKTARTMLLGAAPHAVHQSDPGSKHPNWVSKDAYKSLNLEEQIPF